MAYESEVANAQESIQEAGELCSYQPVADPVPGDPTKPWKVNGGTQPVIEPVPAWLVFVDATSRDSQGMIAEYVHNTTVPVGNKKGLMANNGITPKMGDLITRPSDGLVYKVDKIKVVQPGAVVILWKLELSL